MSFARAPRFPPDPAPRAVQTTRVPGLWYPTYLWDPQTGATVAAFTSIPVVTWRSALETQLQQMSVESCLPSDKDHCLICYERKKSVAFVSCGHMSACPVCVLSLAQQTSLLENGLECPICKKRSREVLRIFS